MDVYTGLTSEKPVFSPLNTFDTYPISVRLTLTRVCLKMSGRLSPGTSLHWEASNERLSSAINNRVDERLVFFPSLSFHFFFLVVPLLGGGGWGGAPSPGFSSDGRLIYTP